MTIDQRKVVGTCISSLSKHVTIQAECNRRYGKRAKDKRVEGVVDEVENIPSKTGRSSCYIHGLFDFSGGVKKGKRLHISSVRVEKKKKSAKKKKKVTPVEDNVLDVSVASSHPSTIVAELFPTPTNSIDDSNGSSTYTEDTESIQENPVTKRGHYSVKKRKSTPTIQLHTTILLPTTSIIVHGKQWHKKEVEGYSPPDSIPSINGTVNFREWKVKTATGDQLCYNSDIRKEYSRLDYFLMMFPTAHLETITRLTNHELGKKDRRVCTCGEILKFIGIIILATNFEFPSRRNLWRSTISSKFFPAPNFGKTGMTQGRFDDLWSCIRFSKQPDARYVGIYHEKHRWLLVDDFVREFNEHREKTSPPQNGSALMNQFQGGMDKVEDG